MITFPRGLVDSLSESSISIFRGLVITKLLGLIKSCDLIKLLEGLENLSSTADITLLAALVPISDPNFINSSF